MKPLTLLDTLEYYDVPQIFVAADATGIKYLCLLYQTSVNNGYLYLGVQISESRLKSFVDGKLDLRNTYLHPEAENALYLVTVKDGIPSATTVLQPGDISEVMLPESGYYYEKS